MSDSSEGGMQLDTRDKGLTHDDFRGFADDGQRHEIIEGAHRATARPSTRHQTLLGRVHVEIELYLRNHPGTGRTLLAPLDMVLSKWDVVEPDLVFVAAAQDGIVTEKNVQGAPALVIEIASPETRKRDQGARRKLFDRAGVREYWIVDPDSTAVRVFRRPAHGSFDPAVDLKREDTLTSSLLPGLEIRLNELFA